MPESLPTANLAGLPIGQISPLDAVDTLYRLKGLGNQPKAIHFLSAHTIALSEKDAGLKTILRSGDWLLPDSRWLEIFSAMGKSRLTQVRGPDFFRDALVLGEKNDARHFFIGPSELVNIALLKTIRVTLPGVSIAGSAVGPHPPLTPEHITELAQQIPKEKRPVVWVGVGTPSQNFLVHDLAKETGLVVVGVGAAFEFLSNLKPEAPRWVSRVGLEWLYRLLSEPKRLWRRYLWGNAVFVFAVVKYRFFPVAR